MGRIRRSAPSRSLAVAVAVTTPMAILAAAAPEAQAKAGQVRDQRGGRLGEPLVELAELAGAQATLRSTAAAARRLDSLETNLCTVAAPVALAATVRAAMLLASTAVVQAPHLIASTLAAAALAVRPVHTTARLVVRVTPPRAAMAAAAAAVQQLAQAAAAAVVAHRAAAAAVAAQARLPQGTAELAERVPAA